jgi:hypothetical protein
MASSPFFFTTATRSFSIRDILLRNSCTSPDSLPAEGPEELSAYGVTGVTCNKASSARIQKIKKQTHGFKPPIGSANEVVFHSQK